jgi:hypothetical protein
VNGPCESYFAVHGRDFLDQLGGHVFGQVGHVLASVELHDIRADDIGFEREQGIDHLSRREAARLLMRYTGSMRRIERVQVEAEVDGAVEGRDTIPRPILHLNHLHAEAAGLFLFMPIQGSDANLNKTFGQPFFHDACERTGV